MIFSDDYSSYFIYGSDTFCNKDLTKEWVQKKKQIKQQIVGQGDKGLKLWHSSWYNYS